MTTRPRSRKRRQRRLATRRRWKRPGRRPRARPLRASSRRSPLLPLRSIARSSDIRPSALMRRAGTMAGMEATRRLTVERNRLRFAAAHMATFRGECEPLHGHNYDVIVELEGALTEESWVWDFGEVKRETKAIADELD